MLTLSTPLGTGARTGAALAVSSMLLVQLGLALAIGLVDRIGADGAGWLRLAWAGVLLAIIVRPRPNRMSRPGLIAAVALGVVIAGVTLLFMQAVARIPLGTAAALEFLGPLSVGLLTARGALRCWAAVAAVGVVLLTEPWQGTTDPIGIAYALAAAACWAAYILLSRRVGDEISGISGLGIALPVAGIVASVVVGPSSIAHTVSTLGITEVIVLGASLALLLPTIPFALEMQALRRLTTSAFGTLMSLEPAIALAIGLVVLHQVPGPAQTIGIGFVVAAGIGAARAGGRPPIPDPQLPPMPERPPLERPAPTDPT